MPIKPNTRQKAALKQRESSKKAHNSQESLRSQYQAIKDSAVVKDLQEKGKSFISYYNKIAQDGIGAKDREGKEIIVLSAEERISYLDQSKGIQAMLDYLERMIAQDPPQVA